MKVDRVAAIKENTFDEGNHASCTVIASTNNGNVYEFAFGHARVIIVAWLFMAFFSPAIVILIVNEPDSLCSFLRLTLLPNQRNELVLAHRKLMLESSILILNIMNTIHQFDFTPTQAKHIICKKT